MRDGYVYCKKCVKNDDVTTASINIKERMNWLRYRMEVNSYLQRY